MSITQSKELPSIREKYKNLKIIFCSGSFDLTHAGHILFFEGCKKYGDILVVMVGNDFNQRIYKKGDGRPILNEHIRLKTVSSLKPVDYAFLAPDAKDGDVNAFLSEVFKQLRPDFYIINSDAHEIPRRQELVKGTKTKLIILERTCPPEFDSISTTKIINKILQEK